LQNLVRNVSTRFDNWTIGRSKQKKILARLDSFYIVGAEKSFMKNRLMTQSSETICALRPVYSDTTQLNSTSSWVVSL